MPLPMNRLSFVLLIQLTWLVLLRLPLSLYTPLNLAVEDVAI